jgi:hypothetical protein
VPLSASERQSKWFWGAAASELRGYFGNTPSIFRMIRSAHWTAAATSDSVLRLERLSNRSSVVFGCRATRIPATIASTRLRPSSMRAW